MLSGKSEAVEDTLEPVAISKLAGWWLVLAGGVYLVLDTDRWVDWRNIKQAVMFQSSMPVVLTMPDFLKNGFPALP